MEIFILIIELIGSMAFSASGAMTGIRKNMDIFGVCILGLTTAVGGGVIRDLVLGNTPPATFRNPIYATVALVTLPAASTMICTTTNPACAKSEDGLGKRLTSLP